jgi:hypothetical protein
VIPRGTKLKVRVDEALGTDRNETRILKGRVRLILGLDSFQLSGQTASGESISWSTKGSRPSLQSEARQHGQIRGLVRCQDVTARQGDPGNQRIEGANSLTRPARSAVMKPDRSPASAEQNQTVRCDPQLRLVRGLREAILRRLRRYRRNADLSALYIQGLNSSGLTTASPD